MESQRLRWTLMAVLGSAAAGAMVWAAPAGRTAAAGRPPAAVASAPSRAPAPAQVADAALLDEYDAAAYPPLPPPGPNDWLTHHPEPGQTLEEFEAAPRREVTAERRVIRLQPLEAGAPLEVSPKVLAEHLAIYFGLPAEASPARRPDGLLTRVHAGTGRRQTFTRDVLRWLEGEVTARDHCVLAITTEDLYPDPSWSFVFGEASTRHGVGVFSFARMEPAFPLPPPPVIHWSPDRRARILRRCLKVVTHETGHMFGLEHCTLRLCVMNGSNHADEMDRQPLHACPTCLAKIRHATGVEPRARHVRLEAFYRAHALTAEADWVAARLARAAPR